MYMLIVNVISDFATSTKVEFVCTVVQKHNCVT